MSDSNWSNAIATAYDPLAPKRVKQAVSDSGPRTSVTLNGQRRPLPTTPWLVDLRRQLMTLVELETEITMQVAVCLANKMSKAKTIEELGITKLDYEMAQQRLQIIAKEWVG